MLRKLRVDGLCARSVLYRLQDCFPPPPLNANFKYFILYKLEYGEQPFEIRRQVTNM
jgi:hypothetical protein